MRLSERTPNGQQKPFEPTEKDRLTVRALAGYGVPQEDIAKVIGISPPTLQKYFREELELAAIEANGRVAQSLFRMATSGDNVAAAIFWLKVRAGWKDPRVQVDANVNVTGGIDIPARPFTVEEAETWLTRRRAQLAELGHKPH